MSDAARQARSLLKLLAIARRTAEAAGRKLADLEASRRSAAEGLDQLEAAIRTEETLALGRADIGFRDFAGYLAGAAAKRAAIIATCQALDTEIAAARECLTLAEIERRKLDHLVDLGATALRKRRNRQESAVLDDAGRRMATTRIGRF